MAITGHVAIVECDAPDCLEVEMIDMTRTGASWMDIGFSTALKRLGWRETIDAHYCPKHAKTAACNAPAAVLK